MINDIVSSDVPGLSNDTAARISAMWHAAHPTRNHVERAGLVSSIALAFDGGSAALLDVALAGATYGSEWGNSGRTLNSLVEDLDRLETIWLDEAFGRPAPEAASRDHDERRVCARDVHALTTTARRSAIAAYAHTRALAARKRVRLARHDILNAIGAMRNAVVLMDDEAADANRANFQGIAKRNSFTAETLVRLHFSEGAALDTELGWEEIAGSELSNVIETTDVQVRGVANVGALVTLVRSLRDAYQRGDAPDCDRVTVTITPKSQGVGRLTVCVSSSADRVEDPRVIDAVRRLSDMLGVTLEDGSSASQLRLIFPLLAGDQRHDLGGTGQGYHSDAVRF